MVSVARDRHPGLAHLPAGTIVTLECHNPPPRRHTSGTHRRARTLETRELTVFSTKFPWFSETGSDIHISSSQLFIPTLALSLVT